MRIGSARDTRPGNQKRQEKATTQKLDKSKEKVPEHGEEKGNVLGHRTGVYKGQHHRMNKDPDSIDEVEAIVKLPPNTTVLRRYQQTDNRLVTEYTDGNESTGRLKM